MLTRKQQRGQMLIGAVLATALIGLVFAALFSYERTERLNDLANQEGAALAQFAVGIRGFIASVQGGSQTMPGNPYTTTGVNWLKPAVCGGLATNPTQGYVPCSYDGGPLGATYSTTITQTPATNTIESRTSFFVPVYGDDAGSRGVMAAKVAVAAMSQQTLPSNGTFLTAFANSPVTANAPVTAAAINPVDRGRVLLVANNSPSNDVFLRVDGTNQMRADLNMGTHSLKNAQDGSFAGNVRAQGSVQIDNGLSVTNGTADLHGGVITPDVQVSSVSHMASQALYDAQIYSGQTSYVIPKPNCSQANLGSSQPAIYVAMQGTGSPASSGGGDALYEAHATVTSSGSNWIVTPVVQSTTFTLGGSSSGGVLTVNLNKTVSGGSPQDQTIMVLTKCR